MTLFGFVKLLFYSCNSYILCNSFVCLQIRLFRPSVHTCVCSTFSLLLARVDCKSATFIWLSTVSSTQLHRAFNSSNKPRTLLLYPVQAINTYTTELQSLIFGWSKISANDLIRNRSVCAEVYFIDVCLLCIRFRPLGFLMWLILHVACRVQHDCVCIQDACFAHRFRLVLLLLVTVWIPCVLFENLVGFSV